MGKAPPALWGRDSDYSGTARASLCRRVIAAAGPPDLFLPQQQRLPDKIQSYYLDIAMKTGGLHSQVRRPRRQVKKTTGLEKTHLLYGETPPRHVPSQAQDTV